MGFNFPWILNWVWGLWIYKIGCFICFKIGVFSNWWIRSSIILEWSNGCFWVWGWMNSGDSFSRYYGFWNSCWNSGFGFWKESFWVMGLAWMFSGLKNCCGLKGLDGVDCLCAWSASAKGWSEVLEKICIWQRVDLAWVDVKWIECNCTKLLLLILIKVIVMKVLLLIIIKNNK